MAQQLISVSMYSGGLLSDYGILKPYCFVKNVERDFEVIKIINLSVKDKLFTVELKSPNIGIDKIKDIVI